MSAAATIPGRAFVWARRNLLSSPLNIILTILSGWLLLYTLPALIQWAFVDATISGSDSSVCKTTDANGETVDAPGACWTFVKVRLPQFLFGLWYTQHIEQIWRPILAFALIAGLFWFLLNPPRGIKIGWQYILGAIVLYPFVAFALINGAWLGLPEAHTSDWGGLMLTLIMAVVGIIAALPIGIALALGRRSDLPTLKALAVIWIELFRGTPLITILFIASVLLPLFFPAEIELDKVLRALVAITIFQSAYTAEAIRGGLSAIPRGQYEAASALSLGYWRSTGLIILPQALKISIPAIVNSFIQLFKDTSLVLIIGLLDLLNTVTVASRSPEWKGYEIEGYFFAALVYFIFCFGMSRFSYRLERNFSTDLAARRAVQD